MEFSNASAISFGHDLAQRQSHGNSMFNGMVITTAVAVVLGMCLAVAFKMGELDVDEPILLKPRFPFIGHLFGMLRWQVGYMQMLSSKIPTHPAFTLRIFSSRIYVICDPSLIQAVYRNTKAFDFGQFVVESSQRAFDIGEAGMKIIRGETAPNYDPNGPYLNGNNGDSYLNEHHKLMLEALSPGTGLSELNKGVLDKVAEHLNVIDGGEKKVGLYRWVRDVLTLATADALYGPHDPMNADHSLIDNLWDFEENMTMLMLNLLPTIIAPKAYRGRAAIKTAFTKYYENHYELTGSSLIRAHLACAQKWGFTADDIANFEISTLFLATTNSVPTSFWQLSYILSSPTLLQQIQKEVEGIVKRENREDGTEEAVMDITLFQSHCPLLVATFHETLRLIDAATSVRAVVEPTTLTSSSSSSSFSLKSPSVIQLPSGITHTSPSIWGPDASSFNPSRFLPEAKSALDKETRRKQNQGYFPFGGGKHLCPGRHFAMMEILAFVAGIVVGFEVEGMDSVPERAFQKLGTAVRKPVADVEVGVKRRAGWEGVKWRFEGGRERLDFKALGTDSDDE